MTQSTTDTLHRRRQRTAELGEAMREAVLATMETDVTADELDAATRMVREVTERLGQRRRARNEIAHVDDLESGIRSYGPVSGPGSPLAPPAHFETTPTGIHGTVTLDRRFEGPPGHVHGGIISLLLDEAFGQAVTRSGNWGLTAFLNITYRRAIPLYTELELYATINWDGERKVAVEGGIRPTAEPDRVYVTATALFVEPRVERHAEYFGNVVDSAGAPASVRLGGKSGW